VRAGEDPLTHYLRELESQAAEVARSPQRRLAAWLGRRSAAPAIVWVDGQPENTRPLRRLLEERGLRVHTALDPESAVAILRTQAVDLIVADLGRGRDPVAGLELLRWIREERLPRRPAVVFASTGAASEYGEEAIALGAAGCTAGTVELLRFLTEHIR